MTSLKIYGFPLLLCGACAVVAVLAVLGKFRSMFGFPLVFAGVCLVLGLLSLWRDHGPRLPRAAWILAGVAMAAGGWVYQVYDLRADLARAEDEALAMLGGKPAPLLTALDPLNTDPAELAATAGYEHRATIISFWATWCSPCWKEMAELQDLYEEHGRNGLAVLALTSYDHPDSEDGRAGDRASAEEFLRQRGFRYPAAITAEGANYRAFGVQSIPSTALVDASGTLVGYAVGLASARDLMAQAEELVTNDG